MKRSSFLHLFAAGGVLAGAFLPSAAACGPFFPTSYLSEPFDEQTQLPTLGFAAELQRVERDLRARLNEKSPSPNPASSGSDPEPASAPGGRAPPEFLLYAEGARAWHAGDIAAAVQAWQTLLQLPSPKRHYRSVRAAFMLGRAAELSNSAEAKAFWHQTRSLAEAGFADSQRLARESLGSEARLDLHSGGAAVALRLYWQQFEQGDPQAVASLQWTLRQVFLAGPEPDGAALKQMATDPVSRGVVAAWFVARGGPYQSWHREESARFAAWTTAVSQAPNLPPEEADRWAWAAYNAGEWDRAAQFAALAPPDAPASEWVRGLLQLRAGHLDESAAHLANAARAFPTGLDDTHSGEDDFEEDSPSGQLDGLRGAVELRRDRYVEALRIFLTADHWSDAAFVAEQVLTIDELKAYVGRETPHPSTAHPDHDLTYLLARRLARAGRYREAQPYYPAAIQPIFGSLVASLQSGYDSAQSKSVRSAAFWAAARLLKQNGMELIGTEVGPDYAVWDGAYEYPDLRRTRDEPLSLTWEAVTRQEKARTPTQRFHYRYRAADLAWLAAALSPDDDARTAEILTGAGNWIADRDPESANLFYKTLVLRCPHTELGEEALQRHWLPRS